MDSPSPIRNISDTALWTAAYRADEADRPDASFRGPYARRLAGERGFEIVRAIKQPAIRMAVVLRTAAVDRLVLEAIPALGCDAVMNLGAGLDTRAWRLDLPATLRWIDGRLREAGDDIRPDDAKSRFAPAEGTAFFEPHGWSEAAYLDLFLDSGKLGRMSVSGRVLKAVLRLLPRKVRSNMQRGLGVVRVDRRG
jgi:hypothetical protein